MECAQVVCCYCMIWIFWLLCVRTAHLATGGGKLNNRQTRWRPPQQQQKKPIDNEAITSINPQQTSWLCSTTVILPSPIVPRHRAGASENWEVQFYGTWARRQPQARLACTRVWWARPWWRPSGNCHNIVHSNDRNLMVQFIKVYISIEEFLKHPFIIIRWKIIFVIDLVNNCCIKTFRCVGFYLFSDCYSRKAHFLEVIIRELVFSCTILSDSLSTPPSTDD